jgi:hypothetical protein
MFILCDTCSILMLIRIAPKMFTEMEYECVTVAEVVQEIKRTQKFKDKHPWNMIWSKKLRLKTLAASFNCFVILRSLIPAAILLEDDYGQQLQQMLRLPEPECRQMKPKISADTF